MTLRVREAEPGDLEAIVDLVGQLGYPSEEGTGRLEREGCGRIYLTTQYRREGAAAFYRRMGFEDTSLRFVRDLA